MFAEVSQSFSLHPLLPRSSPIDEGSKVLCVRVYVSPHYTSYTSQKRAIFIATVVRDSYLTQCTIFTPEFTFAWQFGNLQTDTSVPYECEPLGCQYPRLLKSLFNLVFSNNTGTTTVCLKWISQRCIKSKVCYRSEKFVIECWRVQKPQLLWREGWLKLYNRSLRARSYWQKNSAANLAIENQLRNGKRMAGQYWRSLKPRDVYLAQPNICLS